MPFYTRPLLPKNQSALALGMFRRADRPPAFHQRHPDFWEGWCGRVEGCEAQGGCACCAVRGSKWVAGWRGVRHRAAAPAVRLGGASGVAGWSGCEAQGGCACCAVRVEQVVWQGGAGVRHRAAAPVVRSCR